MSRKAASDPYLSLLKKTARGDREAFRRLYEETSRRVGVYLHRLLGREEMVDDVIIQTYTAVWIQADRFQGRSLVITWIIGIARNLARKELTRYRPHDNIDDHPELTAPTGSLDDLDRRQLMNTALGRLSAQHREILELAFYQDLPYREISCLLGIPVNTVKTRVYHAKAALKKEFDRMGVSTDDI